jgi:type I restriction enzyme S subunit
MLHSVPYLRVANVQRGHLDLEEVFEIDATQREIDDLALRTGDMLLNEGGDRDKLGRGWVWEDQLPLCIHQNHVFRARLYVDGIDPKLISIYGNAFGQPWFVDEGKQTTNLASISKSKLSRFPVPLPPADEQIVLAERVFTLLAAVDTLGARVHAAGERPAMLERAVLAKAFRGELVEQDPADESAAALLARVRAQPSAVVPTRARQRRNRVAVEGDEASDGV